MVFCRKIRVLVTCWVSLLIILMPCLGNADAEVQATRSTKATREKGIPRIEFDSPDLSFDLGQLPPGTNFKRPIKFRNTGSAELLIKKILKVDT